MRQAAAALSPLDSAITVGLLVCLRERYQHGRRPQHQSGLSIARNDTNWAAHIYVYLALVSLGLTLLCQALRGTTDSDDRHT